MGNCEMNSLQPPLIDTPSRRKHVHFDDQPDHSQNLELINLDLEVNKNKNGSLHDIFLIRHFINPRS